MPNEPSPRTYQTCTTIHRHKMPKNEHRHKTKNITLTAPTRPSRPKNENRLYITYK